MSKTVRSSLGIVFALVLAGCGSKPAATAPTGSGSAAGDSSSALAGRPTIVSFSKDPESHTVDKVGGVDGAFRADNAPDLVFATVIDGPFKALFLLETDESGKVTNDYEADTLVGTEHPPEELGGILEHGKFTSGVAVFEAGKLVNEGNGSLGEAGVGPGRHALKLYINEDPRLGKGGHMQILLLAKDGTLVKGPIATY